MRAYAAGFREAARRIRLLAWIVPLVVGVFLVASLVPQSRSFVITVETGGLSLVVTKSALSNWLFPQAHVCLRREANLESAPASGIAECDSRAYEVRKASDLNVAWTPGTELRITRGGETASLRIEIRPGEAPPTTASFLQGEPATPVEIPLPVGSFIVVKGGDWPDNGPLGFYGFAVLGSKPSPGSRSHLISGRYEIRETLFLRSNPIAVAGSSFFAGDQVSVVSAQGSKPLPVEGFIDVAENQRNRGFGVIVHAVATKGRMMVERSGAETAYITSRWFERAANDPIIIGAAVLLGLLMSVVELFTRLRSIG